MTDSELHSRAVSLPAEVSSLHIQDQVTYDRAASKLRDVVTVRAQIIEHHRDMKQKAFSAHRAICDAEASLLKPVAQAESLLKRLIADYETQQMRLQQEMEAMARKKALEQEAQERQRLIEQEKEIAAQQLNAALEEAQTFDEALAVLGQTDSVMDAAVDRARSEVIIPQVVEVEPVMRPARGISTTTTYQVEVESMKELCGAIAEGEMSDALVIPNFPALNKLASATKGKMSIPGCRVVQGTQVSVRKR